MSQATPEIPPKQSQHQALLNAAEQFVAACSDGSASGLLEYFEDTFKTALKIKENV